MPNSFLSFELLLYRKENKFPLLSCSYILSISLKIANKAIPGRISLFYNLKIVIYLSEALTR